MKSSPYVLKPGLSADRQLAEVNRQINMRRTLERAERAIAPAAASQSAVIPDPPLPPLAAGKPAPKQETLPHRTVAFEAKRVQDAHTAAEQRLLDILYWHKAAIQEDGRPWRTVCVGTSELRRSARLSDSGLRRNLRSLQQKLAIELAQGHNDVTARTWRVYSYESILARRSAAKLTRVIRTRASVDLVNTTPPVTVTGGVTVTAPITVTPVPSCHGDSPFNNKEESSTGVPSSSVVSSVLRRYAGEVDDDGIRALVSKCRVTAPDATDEEIAYFAEVKAAQAIRMQNVRNLIGFLLTAVPRCLTPSALADLRARKAKETEAARRAEEERAAQNREFQIEQQAILDDPTADSEARLFAQRFLGLEPWPES
jgi:hypothetical protein